MTKNGLPDASLIAADDAAGQTKNYEIETLRALAITLVMIQHSYNYLTFWIPEWVQTIGPYLSLGQAGVDLFLVVSGYVIAGSFLPKIRVAETSLEAWKQMVAFWVKRIYRLWPTVFLWILVDIILAASFNKSGAFGSFRQTVLDGISALAQVANFHMAHCAQPNMCFSSPVFPLGPLWSLSLEEQFYLLFPILVFALLTWRKLNLLLPILVVIALSQLFLYRPDGSLVLYIRTDALCGGIAIYLMSSWEGVKLLKEPLQTMGPAMKGLVVTLLLVVLIGITGRAVHFNAGISAIMATAFVMIAHYEAGWFSFRNNSVLHAVVTWIAARSFSLYVTHCICIALTRELWWRWTGGVQPSDAFTLRFYVTWLVLMFVVSEFNWRYVETPLRARGRKIAAQWFFARSVTRSSL